MKHLWVIFRFFGVLLVIYYKRWLLWSFRYRIYLIVMAKHFLTLLFEINNLSFIKNPYIINHKFDQKMRNILKTRYDAIIIGAGHNGLVAANYLAAAKKNILVLEQRHLVGGAALTEELIPGFKFSRCSYVLSLFRKNIIKELGLF